MSAHSSAFAPLSPAEAHKLKYGDVPHFFTAPSGGYYRVLRLLKARKHQVDFQQGKVDGEKLRLQARWMNAGKGNRFAVDFGPLLGRQHVRECNTGCGITVGEIADAIERWLQRLFAARAAYKQRLPIEAAMQKVCGQAQRQTNTYDLPNVYASPSAQLDSYEVHVDNLPAAKLAPILAAIKAVL